MSLTEKIPRNPAELAMPTAILYTPDSPFEIDFDEELKIEELHMAANHLGFVSTKYFISTDQAYSLEYFEDHASNIKGQRFDNLTFEGAFTGYSRLSLQRTRGVRALCMCFYEVIKLPSFENIPSNHVLHVPVMSVQDITSPRLE
jgi:hypothetical protein